jgi:hypothetical protein
LIIPAPAAEVAFRCPALSSISDAGSCQMFDFDLHS